MRLKSGIFVSALVRRAFAAGDFAAVERKGADEAGAIFIRQRFRDGLETLYAPAPQSLFEDDAAAWTRLFEMRLERAESEAVEAILAREKKFDPDLWILEIEATDISQLIDVKAD